MTNISSAHERTSALNKMEEEKRCFVCARKLSLAMRLRCRCGLTLCRRHLIAISHECDYDYKALARDQLEKSLQATKAEKVRDKI
jgi:hypothetical protein